MLTIYPLAVIKQLFLEFIEYRYLVLDDAPLANGEGGGTGLHIKALVRVSLVYQRAFYVLRLFK